MWFVILLFSQNEFLFLFSQIVHLLLYILQICQLLFILQELFVFGTLSCFQFIVFNVHLFLIFERFDILQFLLKPFLGCWCRILSYQLTFLLSLVSPLVVQAKWRLGFHEMWILLSCVMFGYSFSIEGLADENIVTLSLFSWVFNPRHNNSCETGMVRFVWPLNRILTF